MSDDPQPPVPDDPDPPAGHDGSGAPTDSGVPSLSSQVDTADPPPSGPAATAEPNQQRRILQRLGDARWDTIATAFVVSMATLFVFATVQPNLIFTENTPTGGDMGSHVWGPMFLMREALPNAQLNGWAPDWYAGFPAFQFYMVVPMLAIVVLHVGVRSPLIVLSLPAALAVIPLGWVWPKLHRVRFLVAGIGVFLTLLVLPIPYGVAFKLVAVSGLVSLPISAWAFGKLSGAPFPVPPALSLGSLFFIYNLEPTLNSGTGNIIGGNMTSTMAGEFSFSISLSLSLVYLGFLIRGLRTGKGRGITAAMLAVCGLCHIIPAFYALGATAVALVVWPGVQRLRWFLPIGPVAGLLSAFWVIPFAGRHAYVNDMGWGPLPHTFGGDERSVWEYMGGNGQAIAVAAVAGLLAVGVGFGLRFGIARDRRAWWSAAGAVGAGLAGAIAVPLITLQVTAVDAGLGIAQSGAGDGGVQTIWSYLRPTSGSLDIPLVMAAVGLAVGVGLQNRLTYLVAAMMAGGAVGFVAVPDGRLWNARLLPLYYLAMFLLAALGVADVLRAIAILLTREPSRGTTPWVGVAAAIPATLAVVVFIGSSMALSQLPTGGVTPEGKSELLGVERSFRNSGSGWARFNFEGLEGREPRSGQGEGAEVPDGEGGWPEMRHLLATMDALGADPDHGCGRAFWEFDRARLESYGTTMSLMMIPYFTEGCIGSMEGLYFESSTTTPLHFITQCKMSAKGSCSQRDLAYSGFDPTVGVDQLAMLGVRYYLAATPTAVDAARTDARLTEVAVSGPWHVYEIADAEPLIVGLEANPVRLTGVEPTQDSWLDASIAWFNDPEAWDVPFTLDGPDEWAEVDLPYEPMVDPEAGPDAAPRRIGGRSIPDFPVQSVRAAQVSDIEMEAQKVSFRVDQPGTPVLVKMSYFPNWKAEGAEGPYRISPNLMVVIPTSQEVVLTYERTSLDWFAYALTLLGVLGLYLMWRVGPVAIPVGLMARRREEQFALEAEARRRKAEDAALGTVPPSVVEPWGDGDLWTSTASGTDPPPGGRPPAGPESAPTTTADDALGPAAEGDPPPSGGPTTDDPGRGEAPGGPPPEP